jgi:hypothetical protein
MYHVRKVNTELIKTMKINLFSATWVIVHTYNPRTKEVETEGSQVPRPGLKRETLT